MFGAFKKQMKGRREVTVFLRLFAPRNTRGWGNVSSSRGAEIKKIRIENNYDRD